MIPLGYATLCALETGASCRVEWFLSQRASACSSNRTTRPSLVTGIEAS
jgi:hypothetical protein